MRENGSPKLPDMVFEVSWEVCNKIGGIHTVLTSKNSESQRTYDGQYVYIGPDTWREEHENPEFTENQSLFAGWKQHAVQLGLNFRIGNWNIPGSPLVIMIDFTSLIGKKDEIFSKAWEDYKLDSITGDWDYVEASLFGYAAGMLIRNFSEYHRYRNVIAHFHEWMTGMGVLYLEKEAPYIASVFTTHATTVGRSIAGNGMQLYEHLQEYSGDETAARLNVRAKHSMEKNAALAADVFTTVSGITAEECKQLLGKSPDYLTPNGFDTASIPDRGKLESDRLIARKKLIDIAEAMTGNRYPETVFMIATSGRYEFRNKGFDIFIRSLAELEKNPDIRQPILAFILVPAYNYGPRKSVLQRIRHESSEIKGSLHLTHNLHDASVDPILKLIGEVGLDNGSQKKVNVLFIPCYLNGQDGILNMTYYEVMTGMDYTLFPSYYEPWGYTPIESLACGVPTITTDQSGCGLWFQSFKSDFPQLPVAIAPRKNHSDEELVSWISSTIVKVIPVIESRRDKIRELSQEWSQKTAWDLFYQSYREAYASALASVSQIDRPEPEYSGETVDTGRVRVARIEEPIWKKIVIESAFPEKLSGLVSLSKNIWWTWNIDAENLFSSIDPDLWEKADHNPIVLLRHISLSRLISLEKDKHFTQRYGEVLGRFKDYIQQPPDSSQPSVAYFSMEFGFHSSLKIYSGGLGILAGDYLKEASDRNMPMTGIGLLYRYGYFRQVLTINGEQIAEDIPEQFSDLPIEPVMDAEGNWMEVQIALPGRILHVRLWKCMVGRISLYLLDTDFEANQPSDQSITYHLYGGDEENRLKQEMVLGVGGIRILVRLGLTPDIYHCNEGHSAFIGLERIRRLMEIKRFTFDESLEVVRASTLFTTHTPVPAGHDTFSEAMIRTYMSHYPERLNINWDDFINLGRIEPGNVQERFSMSHLASRLSQEINAVSNLHGEVTRKIFQDLWKGYFPEELHVGYVTNGVHYQTWAAGEWQKLYLDAFGREFIENQSDITYWERIHGVPDEEIWAIRQSLRAVLINYIRQRLEKVSIRRHEPPKQILEINQRLNPNTLTIGFARRFATYKRAHLIFRDLERLAKIVNHPERPVQFIFAGKAHPRDKAGQDLIRYIVEISRKPEFRGRIVFLENYDMTVARKLVQGVDVWLNTPTRPLEASGTSGMKAAMNGVLNFSVLDGWWCEGYKSGAGWALQEERIYDDQNFQDELDVTMIYNLLEEQIVPLYYNRNKQGVPEGWIRYVKNAIALIAPHFTTRRMIDDYSERFYRKLNQRCSDIKANNYHLAREITRWKKRVSSLWDSIEVIETKYSMDLSKPLPMGEKLTGEVILKLNGLAPEDVGVELLVVTSLPSGQQQFLYTKEFTRAEKLNGHTSYRIAAIPTQPGVFNYCVRIYPKNNLLPHRQDFVLLKWA